MLLAGQSTLPVTPLPVVPLTLSRHSADMRLRTSSLRSSDAVSQCDSVFIRRFVTANVTRLLIAALWVVGEDDLQVLCAVVAS